MSEPSRPISTDRRARKAILTAADFIESHPNRFNFESVSLPKNSKACGSPGCAMGWIAFFSGIRDPADELMLNAMAQQSLGMDYWGDFDAKMAESKYRHCWRDSAKKCAYALHRFANKYFPETKRS